MFEFHVFFSLREDPKARDVSGGVANGAPSFS
jgi:hypothetical protein